MNEPVSESATGVAAMFVLLFCSCIGFLRDGCLFYGGIR